MLQKSATTPTSPPPHLLGVLRVLWQWRKPILLTTLAGAILSVAIALLLPEYYTSTTSFVAISPEQASIEGTFGAGNNRVQFYGTGDDIDRMLYIAESNEVIDYLVDRFDLYTVYAIDSSAEKAPVYVRQQLLGLYGVERTPRDVIELSIQDKDPQRAATMVNAARARIDSVNLALIRKTQRRNAAGLQREVNEREKSLAVVNQELRKLRGESGIYNTQAQSETLAATANEITQQLVATEARLGAYRARGGAAARDSINKLSINLVGLERSKSAIDSQLVKLNDNVGLIDNLEEERIQGNEVLGYHRIRLEQYETILSADRSTLEVMTVGKVPVAKSWPIRWLIVAGSTVIAFIFAVVGALLIENGRRYDWRSITR